MMEKIKIQISDVEGMTLKIPTEFSAWHFNKFFEQMMTISRSLPDSHLLLPEDKNITPERLRISRWQDKDECLQLLDIWESQGKMPAVKWIEESRDIILDDIEISRLSQLIASIRAKYKEDLKKNDNRDD